MTASFSSRNEDDVPLTRIDIVILEDEELVDAKLLQRGNLDDGAYGAHETAVEDNVLLAADLEAGASVGMVEVKGSGRRTHTFKEVEQVATRLVADLLRAEVGARSHGGSAQRERSSRGE